MRVIYTHTWYDYREEVKATVQIEEETIHLAETLEEIRGEIAKSFWSDPEGLEKELNDLRTEYLRLQEDAQALKKLVNEKSELLEKAGVDTKCALEIPF